MKILGIIPARGKSKSIPFKNTKKFCGKPLIAWSILSAQKSKKLDRVIVSTDNLKIAQVARRYGAETPYLQPREISGGAIGMEQVLKYSYEWFIRNENYRADVLVLLLPTSPIRQTFHIDEMVDLFLKTKADSVVAVNETPANHTPYWTLVKSQKGRVTLFDGSSLKNILTRRQDFPQKCYARNDLGYILKPANLYENKPNLYGDKVELYIVPKAVDYEADINTKNDWHNAEIKVNRLLVKTKNNKKLGKK